MPRAITSVFQYRPPKRFYNTIPLLLITLSLCGWWYVQRSPEVGKSGALTDAYVKHGSSQEGRWYIPRSWLDNMDEQPIALRVTPQPLTPMVAAELALELAIRGSHYIENTNIPLIVHQTWKDFESDTWDDLRRNSVEGWLEVSSPSSTNTTGVPEMAYIMWNDEGMNDFIEVYEETFFKSFKQLPLKVEETDAFRVAVLKWYGGIYADVDTMVLQHPSVWVQPGDLEPWEDRDTGLAYWPGKAERENFIAPMGSLDEYIKIMAHYSRPRNSPVSAIVGIEADHPTNTDAYWRAGYTYPVQVTNWAIAMAPHHPIASEFLQHLEVAIQQNVTRLSTVDPLLLTGPPAFTKTIKQLTETANPHLKFEAVSGLHDPPGGRGKVVAGDILVLPITGFAPGRGWMDNMGSQSLEHPNARLFHAASGSWKHFSLKVHTGKLCRKLFGLCREWSNVP